MILLQLPGFWCRVQGQGLVKARFRKVVLHIRAPDWQAIITSTRTPREPNFLVAVLIALLGVLGACDFLNQLQVLKRFRMIVMEAHWL